MSLIIPETYKSNLNGRETEKAIKFIKDTFQHEIISEDRMRQDKASNSHTEKKDLLVHASGCHFLFSG